MRMSFTSLILMLLLTACGGETSSASNIPKTKIEPVAATPEAASSKSEITPLQRGEKLYKRCKTCHTLGEGEKHKVGPNLWAIYGATAGAKDGFTYSKAMAASDIVWTDETLSGYIENPAKYLPRGKMSFAGLRKPEDRAALLEYLKAETTPAE